MRRPNILVLTHQHVVEVIRTAGEQAQEGIKASRGGEVRRGPEPKVILPNHVRRVPEKEKNTRNLDRITWRKTVFTTGWVNIMRVFFL